MNYILKILFILLLISAAVSPSYVVTNLGTTALEIRLFDIFLLFTACLMLIIILYNKKCNYFNILNLYILFVFFGILSTISTCIFITVSTIEMFTALFFFLRYLQFLIILYFGYYLAYNLNNIETYTIICINIICLIVILGGFNQIISGKFGYDASNRLTMPFEDGPNVTATYLSILIPILFSFSVNSSKFYKGISNYVILITIFIILAFTGSRAGLAGSFIGVFTVVIYMSFYNHCKYILIFLFTVLFFFLSIFFVYKCSFININIDAINRLDNINLNVLSHMGNRLYENWLPSIYSFINRPILGHGLSLQPIMWSENYYLRVLSEHGLIGFVIFIYTFMLILSICHFTYLFSHDRFSRLFSLGFLGSTVSILFNCAFADKLLILQIGATFWLFCGVVVGSYAKIKFKKYSSFLC